MEVYGNGKEMMKTLKKIYEEVLIENVLGDAQFLMVNYELDKDEYVDSQHDIYKKIVDEKGKVTLSGLLNYLKIMGCKLYSIIKHDDIEKIKKGIPVVFHLHNLDVKIKRT